MKFHVHSCVQLLLIVAHAHNVKIDYDCLVGMETLKGLLILAVWPLWLLRHVLLRPLPLLLELLPRVVDVAVPLAVQLEAGRSGG